MTATLTRPPSTSMTVPLTNCDSSEARYTAACAIASGVPNAPYGVPFIIAAAGSFAIGVRTTPGEIALTRTAGDPNSAAHARVKVSIAPFVDAYSAPTEIPNRATQEPRLMIDPDPRAVISGGIAAVRKNGALTLTASTSSNIASSTVSVVEPGKIPALLTSTSIRPPSARVASVARPRDACAEPSRSAAMNSARPPAAWICSTTSAPRWRLRPLTMTRAPSAANAVAIARPMLLVAPVTSAVLSSSRVLIWGSLRGCGASSLPRTGSASRDQGDDGERGGGREAAGDQQHRVDAVHVRDGERLAGGDRGDGARLDERSERRDPGGDAELACGVVDAGGHTSIIKTPRRVGRGLDPKDPCAGKRRHRDHSALRGAVAPFRRSARRLSRWRHLSAR